MAKKTISNTFTVNTILDGESAPYYFQEWFAWSNDTTTASITTPPSISGSWAETIPAQGTYAYLWRKSIRYVWNESTRQYIGDTAQYVRMSGTNGTSIHTRGEVANASSRGNGFADIITDSGTQRITLLDGDAVTQLDDGHLYQWVTEGNGKWLDLGQFKGESGVTYYTHIAWATNVTISEGSVINVEGFTTVKSPNDTTHLWMGVLVNESSGADPSIATSYTWSYTKGNEGEKGDKGDDAITYEVMCSRESITIPSGETSTSATISFNFFSKEGDSPKQAFYTYLSLYKRGYDGTMTIVFNTAFKSPYARNLTFPATTSESAFVMYIWGDNGYTGNDPESQSYLAKAEVPVLKDGDAAVIYKIEFEKNTFAHNLNTNKLAISVQGTVYKIEGATSTPVALTNGNFRLYKVAGNTQVRILPTLSSSVFSYTSDTNFNNETLLKAQLTIDSSVVATECIQIVTSGERGKVGRFYYYSGFDWNPNDNDPTHKLVVNDAQVPYFSKAGSNANKYYVFNPETIPASGKMTMAQMAAATTVGGQIQWNEAPWEVMTDDFKYLITEAIFAQFAQFGSAIISGDWMLSTNGTINGVAYNNGASYNNKPAYTWFDPEYPTESVDTTHTVNGETWQGYNFVPNYAVDLLTGATYQQNAFVKGIFDADWIDMRKGTIANFSVEPDMQHHGIFTANGDETSDDFTQLVENGQLVLKHNSNSRETFLDTPEALHVEGQSSFSGGTLTVGTINIGSMVYNGRSYQLVVDNNGFLKLQYYVP